MYLSDLCTVSVSLAGLPAISIPAGYRKGLPVGVQLVGRRLEEETLLKIAHFLEKTGLTSSIKDKHNVALGFCGSAKS